MSAAGDGATNADSETAKAEQEVDVEGVVTNLLAVSDAAQVEKALVDVKPGIGSCKSRRKLKRTIEQVMAKEEIEKSMNAKVRRRVSRVMGFLAPNPNAREEAAERAAASSSSAAKAAEAAAPAPADNTRNRPAVPYVVFVGQLNFSTTADDLKTFFQAQHVNGAIKVRLLTTSEDGGSRGMAFVELDDATEMHKCIALHRSVLHGKMINIEKSCGGSSKEKRQLKLQEKRKEQSGKLEETMSRILQEYTTSGVINPDKFGEQFKNKVARYGPAILSKALHAYAKLPEEKRKVAKLDALLDKFKEKDIVTISAPIEP